MIREKVEAILVKDKSSKIRYTAEGRRKRERNEERHEYAGLVYATIPLVMYAKDKFDELSETFPPKAFGAYGIKLNIKNKLRNSTITYLINKAEELQEDLLEEGVIDKSPDVKREAKEIYRDLEREFRKPVVLKEAQKFATALSVDLGPETDNSFPGEQEADDKLLEELGLLLIQYTLAMSLSSSFVETEISKHISSVYDSNKDTVIKFFKEFFEHDFREVANAYNKHAWSRKINAAVTSSLADRLKMEGADFVSTSAGVF